MDVRPTVSGQVLALNGLIRPKSTQKCTHFIETILKKTLDSVRTLNLKTGKDHRIPNDAVIWNAQGRRRR